jgi:nitroimidazol reductase NimA-like FMN-containing flavoprotein (pyridoxamine 5'-phosphate oxidase superfamily)
MPVTDRTRLRRHPERAVPDRAVIHAILDAGWVGHVGFTGPSGPVVVPTAYGRVGDMLYLHGSPAMRLARAGRAAGRRGADDRPGREGADGADDPPGRRAGDEAGVAVCVTVTLVDGLVLARSALHHSVNYRSVMVFGTATEVHDAGRKAEALAAFVDHVLPGRSAEARPANDRELRATAVLAVPLTEASAKVATGLRGDEPDDLDLPVWAGIVPLATMAGAPQPDHRTRAAGRPVPSSVAAVLARSPGP